jgi:hypothetical protein
MSRGVPSLNSFPAQIPQALPALSSSSRRMRREVCRALAGALYSGQDHVITDVTAWLNLPAILVFMARVLREDDPQACMDACALCQACYANPPAAVRRPRTRGL